MLENLLQNTKLSLLHETTSNFFKVNKGLINFLNSQTSTDQEYLLENENTDAQDREFVVYVNDKRIYINLLKPPDNVLEEISKY